MSTAGLSQVLDRTAAMCAAAVVPVDDAARAELVEAAEAAGATILRLASWCRGEDHDRYGVCPCCGTVVRRAPEVQAAHKVGCSPFSDTAWHTIRLTKIVRGRARWYVGLAVGRLRNRGSK